MVGEATTAASALPSGLAQAFEHMGMVFRPHPRHTLADIHVERGRRNREGVLQRSPRFPDPTGLA
jgi:hypothetical protein